MENTIMTYSTTDNIFKAANEIAHRNLYSFVTELLPYGQQEGHEWNAYNITRNDGSLGSCKFNLVKGIGADFATGDQFDAIGLYAYVKGVTPLEAAKQIVGDNFSATPPKKDASEKLSEKNSNSDSGSFKEKVGTLVARYHYHTAEGNVAFTMGRFVNAAGKKTVMPIKDDGYARSMDGIERVLYNLPQILSDKDKTVLIVEGEKTAEACKTLFPDCVVTTASFGSNGSCKAHAQQWEVLTDREVIIAADCDEAGQGHQDRICKILNSKAKSITIFNTDFIGQHAVQDGQIVKVRGAAPDKYDLADALDDGFTTDVLQDFISKNSKVVRKDIKTFSDERIVYSPQGKKFLVDKYTISFFKKDFDEEGNKVEMKKPLCNRFDITARMKCGTTGSCLCEITFRDWEGVQKVIMKEGDLLKKDIAETLKDKSLDLKSFSTETINMLREYICTLLNDNEIEKAFAVHKKGVHKGAYVYPFSDDRNNCYTSEKKRYVYLGDTSKLPVKSGTLTDWQEQIGKYCVGNTRLVLACAASVTASVLRHVMGDNGFLLYFSGQSQKGKTTTLTVANSIWGKGKPYSLRATDNAIESHLYDNNDGLITLDELGQAKAEALWEVIYMIGNTEGKDKLGKDGVKKPRKDFVNLGLVSGEKGIVDKLAEAKKEVTGGISVRFIELNAEVSGGDGVFDTLHGFDSLGALSKHLSDASKQFGGTVIDTFLRYVYAENHLENTVEKVKLLQAKIVKDMLSSYKAADSQVTITCEKFALIAAVGEICTQLKIFNFPDGECIKSCTTMFNEWVEKRGGVESLEFSQARKALSRLLNEQRHLLYEGVTDRKSLREDPRGYYMKESEEFWLFPLKFAEDFGKYADVNSFLKILAEEGVLERESTSKLAVKRYNKDTGERKRFYVIKVENVKKLDSDFFTSSDEDKKAAEVLQDVQKVTVASNDTHEKASVNADNIKFSDDEHENDELHLALQVIADAPIKDVDTQEVHCRVKSAIEQLKKQPEFLKEVLQHGYSHTDIFACVQERPMSPHGDLHCVGLLLKMQFDFKSSDTTLSIKEIDDSKIVYCVGDKEGRFDKLPLKATSLKRGLLYNAIGGNRE